MTKHVYLLQDPNGNGITAVPVQLVGADTPAPYFVAPSVNQPGGNVLFAFSLLVSDNTGVVSTTPTIAYVLIQDYTNGYAMSEQQAMQGQLLHQPHIMQS